MTIGRRTFPALAALLALAFGATARAQAADDSGWHLLNMREGVTEISRKIYDLHMLIFWVCVVIGIAVFGFMIWSLVKFRKSKGAVADTTLVHNTKVEIVWTIVPVLILVAMAVPAAKTLVEIEDTRNTGLTIKVTGYQWGWHYDYLDNGVAFHSRLARDSDAARRLLSGSGSANRAELPAERRQPAGRPGGRQGAPARHGGGRDPCLVGAGLRHEERRDPRLHQRNVVQGGRGQDRPLSAASAWSSAAATTASCRSWWK